ncbi:hypothetical protein IMSAG049_00127 [Clostridiales bacterium]|nr:hypothetical protein IMSAG049_00127 [Clostridiales bacterium]
MATVIVSAVVILIVALITRSIINDKKNGKVCSGSCGQCSSCHVSERGER